jgi:hypothetical protein
MFFRFIIGVIVLVTWVSLADPKYAGEYFAHARNAYLRATVN